MVNRSQYNPRYREVRELVAQRVRESLKMQGTTQTDFAIDHYTDLGLGKRSSAIGYVSHFAQGRSTDGAPGERPFSPLELSRMSTILRLLNLGEDSELIEKIEQVAPNFRDYNKPIQK